MTDLTRGKLAGYSKTENLPVDIMVSGANAASRGCRVHTATNCVSTASMTAIRATHTNSFDRGSMQGTYTIADFFLIYSFLSQRSSLFMPVVSLSTKSLTPSAITQLRGSYMMLTACSVRTADLVSIPGLRLRPDNFYRSTNNSHPQRS